MNFIPIIDPSRYRIISRTAAVGLHSCNIINEMRRNGLSTSPSQYSLAVKGRSYDPNSEKIVTLADKILTGIEAQLNNKTKKKGVKADETQY